MKISIIGAGNGGQAMAGHFALLGHEVTLYNRNTDKLGAIIKKQGVHLKEAITGFGKIHQITDNLEIAVTASELIMVTVTANAHRELAGKMAPFLKENQIVVLNPGRTLGALEFSREVSKSNTKKIIVAEAQSLIYACRSEANATVRIIGVKDRVLLAAYPSRDTDAVLECLNNVFNCFIKAENILHTGLENIGAIFHPAIVLFNAASIESGKPFYFYNDMTPKVAFFLEAIDKERIAIGDAFGLKLLSASKWVSYAYKGIAGESLFEKMKNNPAYYKILAPNVLNSRLLYEDIPTGLVPFSELGKCKAIPTPNIDALITICSVLTGEDYYKSGRTLLNLGLSKTDIGLLLENI